MKRNQGTIITIGSLVIILAIGSWVTYHVRHTAIVSEKGTDAASSLGNSSSTPYTDLQGNPFSFDSFRGHIRMVNMWASWTPFSVQELKALNQLAGEYAQKNVVVIAVNRKEPKERAQAFLNTLGALPNIHFAIDVTDAFYTSVGGYAMPETVIFDAAGKMVFHQRGPMTLDQMRTQINATIAAQ